MRQKRRVGMRLKTYWMWCLESFRCVGSAWKVLILYGIEESEVVLLFLVYTANSQQILEMSKLVFFKLFKMTRLEYYAVEFET